MTRRAQILPYRATKVPQLRRILVIGENRSLLRTSAGVLRKTNSEVTCCHPSDIAEYWMKPFDLLVLCHTVSAKEAASIAADARWRWPHIRILQVLRFDFGAPPLPPHADAVAFGGNAESLFLRATELLAASAAYAPEHLKQA